MKERDDIITKGAKWLNFRHRESKENIPIYSGGIAHFSNMNESTLRTLIDLGFADPEYRQNNSPSIAKFLAFLSENPGFGVNGYAVTAERDDVRVSITGLDFQGTATPKQISAFSKFSKEADEITEFETFLRSWWD